MRAQTVRSVAVKSGDPHGFETRFEAAQDRIRHRAWDLYCRRGGQSGTALEDWLEAEREYDAAPLAGMIEEDADIRLMACVAGLQASEISVEALPNEIVVEADHGGEILRYKRFHMPALIDPKQVTARLCGNELDVIAVKAKNN